MEWIMTLVAVLVVLLLVGPLALAVATMLGLVLAGHFLPASPTVSRATFACPFSRRIVTAEFLNWPGAESPADAVSCSAFHDPRRIRCQKGCLGLAETHWGPSPIFPRYALLSGGVAHAGALAP